jgi:RHS repeat-associated protein
MIALGNDNMRRWQSKEYDGLYGKYDFGARYFDPFFGLWMSPDPARQFVNPYTYGGDPLNYVDPTGMLTSWSGGFGVVVSWDKQHGWGFGVGEAEQIGRYGINTSYMFHQDGSNTLDLGFDAKIPIQTPYVYLEINMGLGFSMNSYSGAVFSTHGGACVGEAGNCVGEDQGGSVYFDRGGRFGGVTVYYEVYAQAVGGLYRLSTGYEAGLFGAEGRGLYAGRTVAGVHSEMSERDGTSWGMQESVYFTVRGNTPGKEGADGRARSVMSWGLRIPTLGQFQYFESDFDYSNKGLKKANDEALMEALSVVVEDEEKNEAIIAARIAVDKQRNVADNFYSKEIVSLIQKGLSAAGYVTVDHAGAHDDGTTKITYRKAGGYIIRGYGNIEFCVRKDGSAYSSYNYANRYLTHLLLDVWGYHNRGYK